MKPIEENIVKKACKELNVSVRDLAELLGASEGTVRNWSSSNDLPQWAINFINLLITNKKEKEIVIKVKEIIELTKQLH